MKIYNETKTRELNTEELNYDEGYLKRDKILIAHHEGTAFVKGRTAEEVAAELRVNGVEITEICGVLHKVDARYESGGIDVSEIFPEPDTPAKEAWDEYEDIQVYVPYTSEELKERADNRRHAKLETELAKIKEDIEQETFGLVRDDYAEKKARAAEIINELRVLEGKEPREVTFATAGSNDLK